MCAHTCVCVCVCIRLECAVRTHLIWNVSGRMALEFAFGMYIGACVPVLEMSIESVTESPFIVTCLRTFLDGLMHFQICSGHL